MGDVKKILVTGAAGFIGFHLCRRLVEEGNEVIGLDNINDYYDVTLKFARLEQLGISQEEADLWNNWTTSIIYGNNFRFIRMDLGDRKNLPEVLKKESFDTVVNLAAQAGVRYSIENPSAYIDSNIAGFLNLLESMRYSGTKNLVYASSSSVYGKNDKVPFSTDDSVDNPISLYAATKKSNELMAHTYSHLFGIKTIGLRFFTVYGPWGRPDMAMFLFTDAIIDNKPIKVFNSGNLSRDFTYIDDIIEGILATIHKEGTTEISNYELFNIGNSKPEKLMDFISEIEKALDKKASKDFLPMQPGDVEKTWADISDFQSKYHYNPQTSIKNGINEFVKWYVKYYKKESALLND